MDRLVAIIYPFEQQSELEIQLATRIQVETFVNPHYIDSERYDRVLLVGEPKLFDKATVDKVSILSQKDPDLIHWVQDSVGIASETLQTLTKRNKLGAHQCVGQSEIPLTENKSLTVMFKNEESTLSVWRMKVKPGGSGVASLSFFDMDFGGKLLRSYDIYFSEFIDGWYSFQLPNPIFSAKKRMAVTFKIKSLHGEPPMWLSHQGWSSHAMLIDGSKCDFVSCFETL